MSTNGPLIPGLEPLAIDGVEVQYRYEGLWVHATWPERRGKGDVTTLLRARWIGMPAERVLMSTTRINLLSDSAKRGVMSNLRVKDQEQIPVAEVVHAIADDLLAKHRAGGRLVKPEPVVPESSGWLVYPVWPKASGTGLAAGFSSFKSFAAQALLIQLATGRRMLRGTHTPHETMNGLYLDWEETERTFGGRLYALCKGAGVEPDRFVSYKRMTSPLQDAAPAVADEIKRNNIGAVVIDSMSAAVAGSLNDDDVVNAFWNGIRTLDVPAFVIAHKSAESVAKKRHRFFGSTMSENRIRMAWNVDTDDQGGLVWECFKDNLHGKKGTRLAWRMEITTDGDGEDERMDAAEFVPVDPNNVRIQPKPGDMGYTTGDAIRRLLEDEGPMLTGAIAAAVGKTDATVRKTLNRGDFVRHPDGRWALK